MDTPQLEVYITVALSENGVTECMVAHESYVNKIRAYDEWVTTKRNDTQLWSMKTFKLKIPYPMSFEDMTS